MKEWTDAEIVEEFKKEGSMQELNGEMQWTTTTRNLQRVLFDPRFPESKKQQAIDLMNAFKEKGLFTNNK